MPFKISFFTARVALQIKTGAVLVYHDTKVGRFSCFIEVIRFFLFKAIIKQFRLRFSRLCEINQALKCITK